MPGFIHNVWVGDGITGMSGVTMQSKYFKSLIFLNLAEAWDGTVSNSGREQDPDVKAVLLWVPQSRELPLGEHSSSSPCGYGARPVHVYNYIHVLIIEPDDSNTCCCCS